MDIGTRVKRKQALKKYAVGQLVKRSKHWQKQSFLKGKRQLGIVVDVNFYTDERDSHLWVEWPVVHWVGALMESITHPRNVEIVKSATNQPKVQL